MRVGAVVDLVSDESDDDLQVALRLSMRPLTPVEVIPPPRSVSPPPLFAIGSRVQYFQTSGSWRTARVQLTWMENLPNGLRARVYIIADEERNAVGEFTESQLRQYVAPIPAPIAGLRNSVVSNPQPAAQIVQQPSVPQQRPQAAPVVPRLPPNQAVAIPKPAPKSAEPTSCANYLADQLSASIAQNPQPLPVNVSKPRANKAVSAPIQSSSVSLPKVEASAQVLRAQTVHVVPQPAAQSSVAPPNPTTIPPLKRTDSSPGKARSPSSRRIGQSIASPKQSTTLHSYFARVSSPQSLTSPRLQSDPAPSESSSALQSDAFAAVPLPMVPLPTVNSDISAVKSEKRSVEIAPGSDSQPEPGCIPGEINASESQCESQPVDEHAPSARYPARVRASKAAADKPPVDPKPTRGRRGGRGGRVSRAPAAAASSDSDSEDEPLKRVGKPPKPPARTTRRSRPATPDVAVTDRSSKSTPEGFETPHSEQESQDYQPPVRRTGTRRRLAISQQSESQQEPEAEPEPEKVRAPKRPRRTASAASAASSAAPSLASSPQASSPVVKQSSSSTDQGPGEPEVPEVLMPLEDALDVILNEIPHDVVFVAAQKSSLSSQIQHFRCTLFDCLPIEDADEDQGGSETAQCSAARERFVGSAREHVTGRARDSAFSYLSAERGPLMWLQAPPMPVQASVPSPFTSYLLSAMTGVQTSESEDSDVPAMSTPQQAVRALLHSTFGSATIPNLTDVHRVQVALAAVSRSAAQASVASPRKASLRSSQQPRWNWLPAMRCLLANRTPLTVSIKIATVMSNATSFVANLISSDSEVLDAAEWSLFVSTLQTAAYLLRALSKATRGVLASCSKVEFIQGQKLRKCCLLLRVLLYRALSDSPERQSQSFGHASPNSKRSRREPPPPAFVALSRSERTTRGNSSPILLRQAVAIIESVACEMSSSSPFSRFHMDSFVELRSMSELIKVHICALLDA